MRNLKKVLSLALALVMLLGMMVVGAGATSFKDASSIKNTEAVDVVSGIGVLQGDETGNFNPTGTLSRAEAAVVIAKLDLGAAFGNLATTNASTFSDVPASHWGKAYIDYCAARGLIAGDGAGHFNPDGKVTGVQFGLMVARVLGYEDKAEGMGGADWEVKAASLARKAGLTKDVTIGSQAMTRDEMAQVAYNALTANMVYYRNPGTEINTGNGGSVIINGTPAENVTNDPALADSYTDQGNDGYLQLCEQKFPDLKLKTELDDFKRDVYTWYNAREEIGSYQMDEPAFTYTAATTGSTVSSNLARYDFRTGGAFVYVNGNATTVGRISKAADKSTDPKDVTDSVAELTGNGVAVEVYADKDREIQKIVVVNTYLMKVRQVSSTSVSLRQVSGAGFPVSAVGETNDAFGVLSELKVDDYVMVVPVTTDDTNYAVASAYVPETVSGALTRVDRNTSNNTTDALTVAGTAYDVAENQAQIEGQPALDSITNSNLTAVTKKDIGLYLDSYGYAVCAVDAVAATNYLYVMNAYQSLVDGRIVTLVEGVSTDGTVVNVNVGTSGNPSASAAVAGKLVSYTAADSTVASTYRAEYVLSEVTTTANTTAYAVAQSNAITAPATTLVNTASVPYAGDVKFIFVSNGQVAVRDGVQNVALTGGAQYKALVVKNGANNMVVSAVFVPSEPTDIGSNLLYLSAFKGFTELNNTGAARYDAYIEGAKETIVVKGTNASLAGAFYSYSKDEELDLYTVNFYADSGNPKTGVTTSARVSNLTAASDIKDYRLIDLGSAKNLNAGSAVVTNLVSGFNVYSVRDIYDLLAAGRKVTVAAIYNDATGSAKKGTVEYLYVTAITAVGADAPLTKPTESDVTETGTGKGQLNTSSGTGTYAIDVTNGAGEKTTGATVNLSGDVMTALKAGGTGEDVTITTDIGTVTIPQEMFATSGDLASATNVTVTVEEANVDTSKVPANENDVFGFSIEVTKDGAPVSGSLANSAEITVVKSIAGLTSPKVYIVGTNGALTEVTSPVGSVTYADPTLTVTVKHLSDFVVTTEKTKTPAATVPSDAKTVTVDDTATVTVTKADSTATITATSSDTTKATVAVSGNDVVITGVAAGTATVTITVTAGNTAEYSNVTQAVSVTVSAEEVVEPTKLTIARGSAGTGITFTSTLNTTAKTDTVTAAKDATVTALLGSYSAANGTVKIYSDSACETEITGTGLNAAVTGKAYYLKATPTNAETHSASDVYTVTVTIQKASITAKSVDTNENVNSASTSAVVIANGKTLDLAGLKALYTVTGDTGAEVGVYTDSTCATEATDADLSGGTATVYLKVAGGDKYADSDVYTIAITTAAS